MLTHRPMVTKPDDIRLIINKGQNNDPLGGIKSFEKSNTMHNFRDSAETFYSIDNDLASNKFSDSKEKDFGNKKLKNDFGSVGDSPISPSSTFFESPQKKIEGAL